jgi:protein-disulfide isomerase
MEIDFDAPHLAVPVSASDHASGREDASVTLVEYGDYECPHCGRAYPIIKELQKRLGANLRFVFRNFPLTRIHAHAEHAAEAAEAAAAQGKFWEMHDAIFENQRTLDDLHLIKFANELALDVVRFEEELKAGLYAERVRADFRGGVRSGVNGTPTFFINGVRHNGAWELEDLLTAIKVEIRTAL